MTLFDKFNTLGVRLHNIQVSLDRLSGLSETQYQDFTLGLDALEGLLDTAVSQADSLVAKLKT